MRIGSLCSGIGGLELGLERAGLGTTAWQCEYDPHASEVLARHWDVPNHGDVKLTDWTQVEPVEVICAGYPCQPFSTAGRRQGTDDERHLWPAVRDAVGSLGPSLVVLENVRGHLSLGFQEVLGDLADLGFDAGWCLLRASDVGAPHQRARLFVAAYRNGERLEGAEPVRQRFGLGQWDGDSGRVGHIGSAPHPDQSGPQGPQPAGRHDLPTGSDPLPADATGERRGQRERSRSDVEHDGLQPPFVGEGDVRWGPYAPAIRRWEAIHGPAPAPTTDGRLSPDFVCWMQGFPAGWVDGLTRTAALRCLGNAVVPQVAERFGRMILGETDGTVQSESALLPTPTAARVGQRTDVTFSGDGRETPNKLGWAVATLLPTPTANQPGGTAERHIERKLAMGRTTATVTDLGMLIEQVLT